MAHTIDLLTDSAATSEVNGAVEVWRGSETTKGAALVEVVSGNNQVVLCTNKTTTGAVTADFSGTATALQVNFTGTSFSADVYISLDGVNFAKIGTTLTAESFIYLQPVANATYKLDVTAITSGSLTAVLK